MKVAEIVKFIFFKYYIISEDTNLCRLIMRSIRENR